MKVNLHVNMQEMCPIGWADAQELLQCVIDETYQYQEAVQDSLFGTCLSEFTYCRPCKENKQKQNKTKQKTTNKK